MAIDQKTYLLLQHVQALEATKKSLEERKKMLEETLRKLDELGKDRKIYINVYNALLVESSYDEAKKIIEEEIALLESRIAKLEKQIEEIKSKLTLS